MDRRNEETGLEGVNDSVPGVELIGTTPSETTQVYFSGFLP